MTARESTILLTGGIGDFFAVESLMTAQERANLEAVVYATRAHKAIRQLIGSVPAFPKLKYHIVLLDDWSKRFCYLNRFEVLKNFFQSVCPLEKCPPETVRLLETMKDFSIEAIFPHMSQRRFYQESSFIKYACTNNFYNFQLPSVYYCIQGHSPNDRRIEGRDFSNEDWQVAIDILERHNVMGVCLGIGNDHVPDHARLINLYNKTTIQESLEILKNGRGFIGVDSCLSVLAAKLFKPPCLAIKCRNNHGYVWKHCYFAPHKQFDFLVWSLKDCKR